MIKRVCITIDTDLLERLDKVLPVYVSRSAMISALIDNYIKEAEVNGKP